MAVKIIDCTSSVLPGGVVEIKIVLPTDLHATVFSSLLPSALQPLIEQTLKSVAIGPGGDGKPSPDDVIDILKTALPKGARIMKAESLEEMDAIFASMLADDCDCPKCTARRAAENEAETSANKIN